MAHLVKPAEGSHRLGGAFWKNHGGIPIFPSIIISVVGTINLSIGKYVVLSQIDIFFGVKVPK